MDKVGFFTTEVSKTELIKNEIAFDKLHPRLKGNYNKIIESNNFSSVKARVLGVESRKPLCRVQKG